MTTTSCCQDVFKLKFIRSIAEALQIPKHRVKVRALPPDEDFCHAYTQNQDTLNTLL